MFGFERTRTVVEQLFLVVFPVVVTAAMIRKGGAGSPILSPIFIIAELATLISGCGAFGTIHDKVASSQPDLTRERSGP